MNMGRAPKPPTWRPYHVHMPTTHLLYLHGFRSSPLSNKVRLMQARARERHPDLHFWCPQLPASPRAAMDLVTQGIAQWPHATMAVVGSSLGGFYATWVAEQIGCRCAVLNPVVHAARDLAGRVGTHANWHDASEQFDFLPGYLDELRDLAVPAITRAERYYALIAKGDELLDWREMAGHYPGARPRLLEGSDHALSDFAEWMDEVFDFIGPA